MLVAVFAGVAVVVIGLTTIGLLQTKQHIQRETQRTCLAIENLKGAITDGFRDGRARLVARRATLDPDVYREMVAYYDRQLARFKPKEC